MALFSKAFGLLVFVVSYVSSIASQPDVAPSFFSDIKTIKPSEIPAYIDRLFIEQSKIKPSQRQTREKEIEVGDIVQPLPSYIIDFAQAIRNSARHMIQSGHMGWFQGESHASAKAWPSFFYTQKTPFTKIEEAETVARELIEKVVRSIPLSFHGEIYSGNRILIGVDFIGDIPSSISGICFGRGYGKLAPVREGYKPKNISKLQEQNASLINSLSTEVPIETSLGEAMPTVADKVILRVSFRKDPLYRDKSAGIFLKYNGYFIDFLSLYPVASNPEATVAQMPIEVAESAPI